MKKLGVMITAFNEPRFIRPVIEQFKGLADHVVVGVSLRPWNSDIEADDTFTLASKTFAEVYEGLWISEANQRNFLMSKLKDCDYVLVCHTDTFFTREDIKALKTFIQTADDRQYDIQTHMYWRDLDTVVEPEPLLRAMLIKQGVPFIENVRIEDMSTTAPIVPNVVCHHLSWAKTDEEIRRKIDTYGHANEILDNWYEEVWLKDKDTDFAPTQPTDYKSKKKYNCPNEIRRYFETA